MVVKSESSGSLCRRAVKTPSVTTRRRVSALNLRSKRTCQPTSRPRVQPRSWAMRAAIARAATRRGCSRMTGPSASSAGGTRVVFPAPGAAVTTAARDRRTVSRIESRNGSIGREITPRASRCGTDSDWTSDARPPEAAVAVGILRQVLLVILLGVVELRRRQDLRRDRAVAGGSELRLKHVARALGGAALLIVEVVDA